MKPILYHINIRRCHPEARGTCSAFVGEARQVPLPKAFGIGITNTIRLTVAEVAQPFNVKSPESLLPHHSGAFP
jgi:hypothetical protein